MNITRITPTGLNNLNTHNNFQVQANHLVGSQAVVVMRDNLKFGAPSEHPTLDGSKIKKFWNEAPSLQFSGRVETKNTGADSQGNKGTDVVKK